MSDAATQSICHIFPAQEEINGRGVCSGKRDENVKKEEIVEND